MTDLAVTRRGGAITLAMMGRAPPFLWFVAALGCVGCGGESAPPSGAASSGAPPAASCAIGERPAQDGTCLQPGVQDDGCPAGQAMVDGSCVEAGIAPERCATGFTPTDRSCEPTMPAQPCSVGAFAVPGDSSCHPVGACGAGPWPDDLVADSSTQYVDAAYGGGVSDGSSTSPWTSIQAAVDAASAGATIAVAAGRYAEDVAITGKALNLLGRCPELVAVVGTTTAISVSEGASGSAIRGASIESGGHGIFVSGAEDVVIDRVWIHDVGARGLDVEDTSGVAEVTLKASLVESSHEFGVFVAGATLVVEDTSVRDTWPDVGDALGHGIHVQNRAETSRRANVTVRHSVVERNHHSGIYVEGSDVVVEGTVVRDTELAPGWIDAAAVAAVDPSSDYRPSVAVRGCYVDGNIGFGIVGLGAELSVEDTVIHRTTPAADGLCSGIDIEGDYVAVGRLEVHGLVVESTPGSTVQVTSADALIDRALIREPNADGLAVGILVIGADGVPRRASATVIGSEIAAAYSASVVVQGADANLKGLHISNPAGWGIHVFYSPEFSQRSNVTIAGTLVDHSVGRGIGVFGADAVIDSTIVRNTELYGGGEGTGVHCQILGPKLDQTASVAINASLLENSHTAGLMVIGSDATVDNTIVRSTDTQSDGTFGDGIAAISFFGDSFPGAPAFVPSTVAVASARIEKSARVGLSAFAATASVQSTAFECNAIDIDGEALSGEVGFVPFGLTDGGGNACGCGGASEPCRALSTGLVPPPPQNPPAP